AVYQLVCAWSVLCYHKCSALLSYSTHRARPFVCQHNLLFLSKDPPNTYTHTLSLHDALPIYLRRQGARRRAPDDGRVPSGSGHRSEEHTSELQSPDQLVCSLLLEKKKHKADTS